MSAIPGSYRSLVDPSSSQSQGTQRQHIGAQILWILMMIFAPFLCPAYLIVSICWVCLIGGRMSAETKVTIFVMMVFFSISWIPLVSLIVYLKSIDPNASTDEAQIKMVNGLTPIAAYYMFTIWGIVVAFRRFKLTDAYEIETSRRDVACLKDIIIEPRPIPIPGAREMVKAMKAHQAAKRNAFDRKKHGNALGNSPPDAIHGHNDRAPWYKRIFGRSNSSASHQRAPNIFEDEDADERADKILAVGEREEEKRKETSAAKSVFPKNATSTSFVLPSDEVEGENDDTAVTINTVTDITNALELYVHLKGKPKYIKVAALSALTLAAATITIVRTLTVKQNSRDALWYLSTAFFCGMFLVFYSVFAFIITMYLNQVRFIQRLTSAIVGDRNSGIAWVRAHNLSHLRAWEAVRRLAVLEITNPDSVLNSLFTPSMFLSSLACLIIAAYIILRLLFEMVEVGPFILTLLVLFVLLLGFMILVTGVANYAQSHLKLHTSIIAQKTYEIAKLIDEKYSDIERGLLIETGATEAFAETDFVTEGSFAGRGSMSRARRNTTIGTNWGETEGNFDDDFDDVVEDLKASALRNSSLADPENARAQLEMLFQERKLAMPKRNAIPQSQSQRQAQGTRQITHMDTKEPVGIGQSSRNNIRLPGYFQQAAGTAPVGFSSTSQQAIQTVMKQSAALTAQQMATNSSSSVPYGASRHGSNLDPVGASRSHPGSLAYRLSDQARSTREDSDEDSSQIGDAERVPFTHTLDPCDAEGLEKLSIATLESCHASLLSLCNYFVANQPRPLILGMQLQNVRYAIVFVLLISGNLMFLALMMAFKNGKCQSG